MDNNNDMFSFFTQLKRPQFLIIFGASFFIPVASALAQNKDYTLLVPIPSFGSSYNPGLFVNYVQKIITLSITLAAIAAVARITIGGFQYMGGESMDQKSAGREAIKEAIFGLIILGASYLILNTINPNLLNFRLEVPAIISGQNTQQTQQTATTQPDGTIINGGAVREAQQATINQNGVGTSLDPARQYQLQEPGGVNQRNLTSESCQSWVAAKARQGITASCVPQ
jgi:hypothetical protein